MPELKPAYLVHGDDHGAIAERRAGLRALCERSGAANVELLEGDAATPAAAAAALAAMTLAIGRRVIVVEGVERWREADVVERLAPAMREIPPDTTLALFAREEARAKAPPALHEAVAAAGGQVVEQATVKPWELPRWVREQAARHGLALDSAAAKALVAQVGERQQRLLRELEKLALEGEQPGAAGAPGAGAADPPGAGAADPPGVGASGAAGAPGGDRAPARVVDVEQIERRAAHSAEWRSFALADALVGGGLREATSVYLRLREQGERPAGLTYVIAQRLRDALAVANRLGAGESVADVKRSLRMPRRAADRLVADVQRSDPERLRAALAAVAQLELDSRGGAPITRSRGPLAGMDEDTLAVRAIEAIAG